MAVRVIKPIISYDDKLQLKKSIDSMFLLRLATERNLPIPYRTEFFSDVADPFQNRSKRGFGTEYDF